MKDSQVIIIGAGIGGLTTAAYLSRAGISSIMLEQSDSIGGRCSTRTVDGYKYEIGSIYVGGGVFDNLKNVFGIQLEPMPVRCYIKSGERGILFPFGWRTLIDLKSCGVPLLSIFGFLWKSAILSKPSTFKTYKSVGELLDFLVSHPTTRAYFDAIFGVSGVSPYRLPSCYLFKNSEMVQYKADKPGYLPGGNGEISSVLRKVAQENSKLILREKVEKIIIKNSIAQSVKTDKGEYSGNVIVSNTGIKSTILRLTNQENWREDYKKSVSDMKETLKIATIFFTFNRSFPLPGGYTVFFVNDDIVREFQVLEDGLFYEQPMFILHVPSNIETESVENHRATLQFYYPDGDIPVESFTRQVEKIMNEGLDRLFTGFSKAITGYSAFDPLRYKTEFGFTPHVFGISPDLDNVRFPVQTQIDNLYCVGDSVLPHGPGVPQAMESGLRCGAEIVAGFDKRFR